MPDQTPEDKAKEFEKRALSLKIYNYLDISSGHISKSDAESLDVDAVRTRNAEPNLIVFKYPEGWFVNVPQGEPDSMGIEDEEALAEDYSPEMLDLLRMAIYNDCCFVRIDADGNVYDNLPRFEW